MAGPPPEDSDATARRPKRRRGRIFLQRPARAATIGPCSSRPPAAPPCLPRQPTAAPHRPPGRSPSASFATRSRSSRPASRSSPRGAPTAATSALPRTRSTRSRSTRRSSCGASTGARRASPRSRTRERYAINVLAHDQVELARRFSRPHADRFAGVALPPRRRGRAADRGLHRMVRMPPPRASTGPATTSSSSAKSRPASAAAAAGLVFHHGRYATTRTLAPNGPLAVERARCERASAPRACLLLEERVHLRGTCGPGTPPANGLPSSVVTASTSFVDDESHISSAASASAFDTGAHLERQSRLARELVGRVVGDAREGSGCPSAARRSSRPSRSARSTPTPRSDSRRETSPSRPQPASAASWRISTLPTSEIVFRSQRRQRLSSAVTTATPRSTCSAGGRRERVAHHEHGRRDTLRKCVVALRHAARHLEIDALVVERLASRRVPR